MLLIAHGKDSNLLCFDSVKHPVHTFFEFPRRNEIRTQLLTSVTFHIGAILQIGANGRYDNALLNCLKPLYVGLGTRCNDNRETHCMSIA
jgi:hypothetical protein